MRVRLWPLFIPLLGACAPPSLLVEATDPVFARAQSRLIATEKTVDALQPAPEERALFLQAEGFYDYRFSFPRRSFWGYFAEGAAAVTDFPALQSFSSSLDLADLRVNSSDGSIQLWETLLARHPSSPLAPLALYRLGWAYRNTSAKGFPRRSGDEAFALLIKEHGETEWARLASEARLTRWKSKSKAGALSLLPGAGQIYEGRTGSGIVRLAIGAGAAALVAAPAVVAYQRRKDLSWNRDWTLLGGGFAGAVVISIDYTAAYQDSVKGAIRFNEDTEAAFEDAHTAP